MLLAELLQDIDVHVAQQQYATLNKVTVSKARIVEQIVLWRHTPSRRNAPV